MKPIKVTDDRGAEGSYGYLIHIESSADNASVACAVVVNGKIEWWSSEHVIFDMDVLKAMSEAEERHTHIHPAPGAFTSIPGDNLF